MNTETKSKTTGRYDEDFKRQAVELLLKSGRKLKPLAKELGLSATALRGWRDGYLLDASPEGRHRAALTMEDVRAENERLRRENETLRVQRDILKKAVGILSEPPPRGMP
jgi:transposase